MNDKRLSSSSSSSSSILLLLLLLLVIVSTRCAAEDTVAEDLDAHQLQRLVELLTSRECEDLLVALSSHPEENVLQHLQRLLPENNDLHLPPRRRLLRVRREEVSEAADDGEEAAVAAAAVACRTSLGDWLRSHGEQIFYDRLSRGLQRVGRTDIAVEVGKNINQDKALSLKRFVEDYHKYVRRLETPPARPERERRPRRGQRHTDSKVRGLTLQDLDLVLHRAPALLPRGGGVLDAAWALLYGLLLGTVGTFLLTLLTLLILHTVVRVSSRRVLL